MSPGLRRPNVRRAVVLFPSGLTLFNLFWGVFAIIAASRGQFQLAGWYVVLGGVCDALDGRVARATSTGGRFGEELDSLVDAISFGLAPAMIMYFAVLNKDGWDWIWAFAFVAAAVVRLARFNLEQAGHAKTYFQGLPSPAAGITLATYYWFSQTPLYQQTAVGDLPWPNMLRFVMGGLSFLMVSNVPYPVLPPVGLRTVRGWIGTGTVLLGVGMLIFGKREYFFPIAVVYVAFGLVRSLLYGLTERRTPEVLVRLARHAEHDREAGDQRRDLRPEGARHAAARAAGPDRAVDEPGAPRRRKRRRRGRADRPPRPDGGSSAGTNSGARSPQEEPPE